MTRIGRLMVSVALLGGCAAPVVDESSPGYRIPLGSAVVLQQELAIPEGHARVFLQGGAVVERHRLNPYRPHCNFEQRAVSEGTARIAADRFTVVAVSVGEDFVVQRRSYVYAALRLAGDDDSPGMVNRYIHHRLESARQPEVMRLTCHGGFEVPGKAEYPGLVDIRYALGSVAAVELP